MFMFMCCSGVHCPILPVLASCFMTTQVLVCACDLGDLEKPVADECMFIVKLNSCKVSRASRHTVVRLCVCVCYFSFAVHAER